jgi:hypothetical protein
MLNRDILVEQNKLVQAELQGVAKGYEQALGWILSVIEKDNVVASVTKDTGSTVTANQEK